MAKAWQTQRDVEYTRRKIDEQLLVVEQAEQTERDEIVAANAAMARGDHRAAALAENFARHASDKARKARREVAVLRDALDSAEHSVASRGIVRGLKVLMPILNHSSFGRPSYFVTAPGWARLPIAKRQAVVKLGLVAETGDGYPMLTSKALDYLDKHGTTWLVNAGR